MDLAKTDIDITPSTAGVNDLRARLEHARDGLKTLLIAWARDEDELPEGARQDKARQTREHWCSVARDFLAGDD